MTKDELIKSLETSRKQFLELLEGITDEQCLEPGVCGEWSIKDILSHLSFWEGQIVTFMYQGRQGMKPTTAQLGPLPVDEVNAQWQKESASRTLPQVRNDFLAVRKQTIRRVAEFTNDELNNPEWAAWLNHRPLVDWIIGDSVDHEKEHGAEILKFKNENNIKS
jgi:hypothetical protein